MKKCYRGNINNLEIIAENIQDATVESKFRPTLIEKNVLFYQNFSGRLIRFDTGEAPNTHEEAVDWLNNHHKVGEKIPYYDEHSLSTIFLTDEQFKQFKQTHQIASTKSKIKTYLKHRLSKKN